MRRARDSLLPAARDRAPRPGEPAVLRLYRRLTERCRTLNQVAKVHIALENRLSPLEVQVLHTVLMSQRSWRSDWRFFATRAVAQVSQRVPFLFGAVGRSAQRTHQRRRWIKRLGDMLGRSGKTERAEPFVRQRLAHGVQRYSSDPAGAQRAAKTLVIGFTGSSARLMLPLPAFLQHLDADRHDLVLVQYPPGRGFFDGVPGVGRDFAETVSRLEALTRPGEYRRAVAIGTSGGALPALLAATRLGLDIAVGIGSKGPDDPRWTPVLGRSAGEALAAEMAAHGECTHVFLVVGADHARDKAAAHALARCITARVLEVSDSRELVGHNPFVPLLRRGELQALLATTIDASVAGVPPPDPRRAAEAEPAYDPDRDRGARTVPLDPAVDAMRRRIAGTVLLAASAAIGDRVLAAAPAAERRSAAAPAPALPWRATFTAFCDTLVPADALTPSASALGVDRALLADIVEDADATRLAAATCRWLDAAGGDSGAPFATRGEAERVAIVERLSREPWNTAPARGYLAVRNSVLEAYYVRPESWRGLALDRPPQPLGFNDAVR